MRNTFDRAGKGSLMAQGNRPDSGIDTVAPDEPIYVMGLGKAVNLRLAAYSVLLVFLALGVFSASTGGDHSGGTVGGFLEPVLYVLVYLAAMVVHELVHGLFFRFFGGRPRYGAGITLFVPYFYATSPGRFSPRQMIIIGLAPLVTISAVSVAGAIVAPTLVGYLAVVFIGNAAGAVGDLWMASRLGAFLRVQDAAVADLGDRMAVFSGEPEAGVIAARLSARDERPQGFVVHWVAATAAVLAIAVLVGIVGSFLTERILIGPAQFPLVEFANTGSGGELGFSLYPPVLAGLLFALAVRLTAWLRLRREGRERPGVRGR